jgi:hypothetical protein
MDIEKAWKTALKETEIIRSRVQALMTNSDTVVPYILLAESSVNHGDTVVRKGQIVVTKPSLIVPPNNPQFLGFDLEEELNVNQNSLINYLLIRGISIPSFMYDNKTNYLDIFEGKLSHAIKEYNLELQKAENVKTGLIVGHEDYWQFSLLIFICSQIARNADTDLRKLLDNHKKISG